MSLALIGNAPSSGSTYLADLLDSTPYSASGPELNLFSNRHLYDYPRYRSRFRIEGVASSLYVTRNRVELQDLPAFGLDLAALERLVRGCATLEEFMATFAERHLALRGKQDGGVVFEKTPQNINTLGAYLDAVPGGRFVHIVRSPVYVYASLLRRGFPPFTALYTWLVDVAAYLPWREDARIFLVRYEDLVRDPAGSVLAILEWALGRPLDFDRAAFLQAYRDNRYVRFFSDRVASWSVKQAGQVGDANRSPPDARLVGQLRAALDQRVHPEYARAFGLAAVSYRQALQELGYLAEVLDGAPARGGAVAPPRPGRADRALSAKRCVYFAWDLGRSPPLGAFFAPVGPA
jgi:hypothetical protein